jgi:hypothetical protein
MFFVKKFNDAYSQSREYFFLDLLNQYKAPVPAVLRNDIPLKELEMVHGGINMQAWLSNLEPSKTNTSRALLVLKRAFECSRIVGEHGVWHLDLALRNFVVDDSLQPSAPDVRLIDFCLAVSKQFPLQKPLWLRPDTEQHHPALQQAIIQDWTRFLQQAHLTVPQQWDTEFEVPITSYENTWLSNLEADRLSLPWCIIVHSLGVLLCEVSAMPVFQGTLAREMRALGQRAQNLQNEDDALQVMGEVIAFTARGCDVETPRPRAVTEPLSAATPAASNTTTVFEKTSTPITTANASTTKTIAANHNPAYPQLPLLATDKTPLVNQAGWSIVPWAKWLANVALLVVLYLLLDAVFWMYQLRLSDIILFGLALPAVATVGCGVLMLISKARLQWAYRAIRMQAVVFLLLAFELWISPIPAYWTYITLTLAAMMVWLWRPAKHAQ